MTCSEITLAEVSGIFKRKTPANLEGFVLDLSQSDPTKTIPMDLLSDHRTRVVEINCPSSDYFLMIDPQAFRSSKNTTESVNFFLCNMSRLDFDFLAGFDRITYTSFIGMSSFDQADWASFPLLPSLYWIFVYGSKGLNDWTTLPQLARGLTWLQLQASEIQDVAMDRILNWTLQSSADTLQNLIIDGNDLKNIPKQIPSFLKLQFLYMNDQRAGIPVIPSGSFLCNMQTYRLYALNNGIATIQDNAFLGSVPNFKILTSTFTRGSFNSFFR